jgi:hypothetical protein
VVLAGYPFPADDKLKVDHHLAKSNR